MSLPSLASKRIRLLPLTGSVAPGALEPLGAGPIYACDCYVEGAERGLEVPGGYQLGRIINVDHHAPTLRMARFVSSANLALCHVEAAGTAGPGDVIVVTHSDCDSVLSSAIVAGLLEADERLGAAAVAADHTGAEDLIADLLQSLDPLRNLDLSFESLVCLLNGRPLPGSAKVALEERQRRRANAEAAVASGRVRVTGRLAFAVLDGRVDSEFFPALLPAAAVILLATQLPTDPGRWQMKLRLGPAAPAGFTLEMIGLREFDPAYGGRWNAGANKRGGGSAVAPEAYAAEVDRRLRSALRSLHADRMGPRDSQAQNPD